MEKKGDIHDVEVLALLQAEEAGNTIGTSTATAEETTEETTSVDGRGVGVGAVGFEEREDLFEEVSDDRETASNVLFVGRVLVDDVALLGLYCQSGTGHCYI